MAQAAGPLLPFLVCFSVGLALVVLNQQALEFPVVGRRPDAQASRFTESMERVVNPHHSPAPKKDPDTVRMRPGCHWVTVAAKEFLSN